MALKSAVVLSCIKFVRAPILARRRGVASRQMLGVNPENVDLAERDLACLHLGQESFATQKRVLALALNSQRIEADQDVVH